MTWIERTAYPRLPGAVLLKELRESFTPSDDEMAWARTRTQPDRHLLALVVCLKSYQRLGYFPSATAIPAPVIDHVRATLGLVADALAEVGDDKRLTLLACLVHTARGGPGMKW